MSTFDHYLAESAGYKIKITAKDPDDYDSGYPVKTLNMTIPANNSSEAAKKAIEDVIKKGLNIISLDVTK